MKQKFSFLLAFSIASTLSLLVNAVPSYAQDEGIPGYELQDPMHPGINTEEKVLLVDPETKAFRSGRDTTTMVSRSSAQRKVADSGKPSGKPKDEEDPLSFNFLYYIIQKFKVSDLIDQQ